MPDIVFQNLSKTFPGNVQAVREVSLQIATGECLALIGPSGSGKTTLLRLLAGLENPTSGQILLDDHPTTKQPAYRRQMGYVTQQSNLFPHLNVRENLLSGIARSRQDSRRYRLLWGWVPKEYQRLDPFADAFVSQLGIAELAERKPEALSAGQRQRVALARVALQQTNILLFDEPLAHLDPIWQAQIREDIAALHRERAITMVYVTHHQAEAFAIASRVGVLQAGRLVQVGTYDDLWLRPRSRFVAEFVGQPPMNLVALPNSPEEAFGIPAAQLSPPPASSILGIRPTDLWIATESSDGPTVCGEIQSREPFADRWMHGLKTAWPNQTHRQGWWRVVSAEPLEGNLCFTWPTERTHWFASDGSRAD